MSGVDSQHGTVALLTAAHAWRTADAELAAAERETRESFRTYRHAVDTEPDRARELWDRHLVAALRLHNAEGDVEATLERLKDAARGMGEPETARAKNDVLANRNTPQAIRPDWRPWPHDRPPQYNGSGSPCDMWIGPCSCGATHTREQRELTEGQR